MLGRLLYAFTLICLRNWRFVSGVRTKREPTIQAFQDFQGELEVPAYVSKPECPI